MRLPILTLTVDDFAPFGRMIELPERSPDGSGPGWRWWGDQLSLQGDGRPFSIGYLELAPSPLRFDWAERHMRSPEMLVPLNGEALVYVAPPDHPNEPGRLPPLAAFRVFRVPAGKAVILHEGVWHGAPLALDGPSNVLVLLLEGTGREDLHLVRFEETPVEIDR